MTFKHIVERYIAEADIGSEVDLDLSHNLCHAAAVAVILRRIDHMQ